MKIWIVNHYALRPSDPGGTRHFSLARRLSELGHEPVIVASAFDHASRSERYLAPGERWKSETVDGVEFLWVRTPPYKGNSAARLRNMFSFAWTLWRGRLLAGRPRPDVILGSSPHLFAALAAERLAKRLRVPFAVEIRDIWPETLIELGGHSPRHPFILLLSAIEKHLYRRARAIITLLPLAAAHIEKRGGRAESIAYVPNGVDLSFFPPPTEAPARPELTIMYAGAHGMANGLDYALDCARLLQADPAVGSRVQFRFIGDGPEKARLEERVRTEGLANIRFEPPVPKQEVARTLQSADAFLMVLRDSPLFRWGINPNKLWDYMASARPVLFAVSTPFNPVEDARCGFAVDPANPAELADAVRKLLALSLDERRAMGRNARAYVEQNHDMSALGDRLDRVLRKLVEDVGR